MTRKRKVVPVVEVPVEAETEKRERLIPATGMRGYSSSSVISSIRAKLKVEGRL